MRLHELLSAVETGQNAKNGAAAQVATDEERLAAMQAQIATDKATLVDVTAQADLAIDAAISELLSLRSEPFMK
jgi:hypothetical protein